MQLLWKGQTVPRKIKQRVTMWPNNPIPKYVSREMKTYVQTKTCTWMFKAALFLVAKKWEQTSNKSGLSIHWNIIQQQKWSTDTHHNIDEPQKHCTKRNKPDVEDHLPYNSVYMKCPGRKVNL